MVLIKTLDLPIRTNMNEIHQGGFYYIISISKLQHECKNFDPGGTERRVHVHT